MTPDREDVVSHMQIMHTWAEFALEHEIDFFEMAHIKRIAEWTEDALALLKEQDARIRDLVAEADEEYRQRGRE